MAALPTTEVFAFSKPNNKAGELYIALLLGAGAQHVLRGNRSVWHGLYDYLKAEFGEANVAGAPRQRQIVRRLRGEDRYRVFSAVLVRSEREEISHRAACEAAGVSLGAFTQWLSEYRRAGYRVPVTKPNGRLL